MALHAGPEEEAFNGTSPEMRKENPGKLKLDCLMMSVPIKRLAFAPLGLFPTYCVLPGTDSLVLRYDYGSQTVIVRRLGTFLTFHVPLEFELEEGESRASVKVALLQTFVPNGDTFATNQLTPVPASSAPPSLPGGVMAGNLIKKVAPVYPEAARQNRTSGIVVLHAIISRTGHIYALRVTSAPDPDLALSAIAAVRQWTYKPYLLNGVPTAVETTIMVNYNITY